jgi:hypothetical protein
MMNERLLNGNRGRKKKPNANIQISCCYELAQHYIFSDLFVCKHTHKFSLASYSKCWPSELFANWLFSLWVTHVTDDANGVQWKMWNWDFVREALTLSHHPKLNVSSFLCRIYDRLSEKFCWILHNEKRFLFSNLWFYGFW